MNRRIVQAMAIIGLLSLLVAAVGSATAPGVPNLFGREAAAIRQQIQCRDIDPAWNEIAVDFSSLTPLAPGRAIRQSDGTVAALLVITAVNERGEVTTFDYSASVRISAVIIQAAGSASVIEIDPPSRSGTGLRTSETQAISSISLCYRIAVPPPPRAGTPAPQPSPERSPTPTRPRGTQTPTTETYEVSAVETAKALAAEATAARATAATLLTTVAQQDATLEAERRSSSATAIALATVNAAATEAAAAQATTLANAHASATAEAVDRATAEARAEQASATAASLLTTATMASAALATAHAEQTTVAATVAALMTEVAAPTATPTPPPAIYEATSGREFSTWPSLPEGWSVDGPVLSYDGRRFTAYAEPPVHPAGIADHAVEIEFRVLEQPECGTNFGVVIRGSDAGYYAGGLEWNCDPAIHIWTPQQSLGQQPIDLSAGWHTLRVEAIGPQISVTLDGKVILQREDFSQPAGGQVAIWSDGVPLEIRAFREIGLGR